VLLAALAVAPLLPGLRSDTAPALRPVRRRRQLLVCGVISTMYIHCNDSQSYSSRRGRGGARQSGLVCFALVAPHGGALVAHCRT